MTENNKQFILNNDLSNLQDCKCVMDNYADVDTWYTLGATVDLLNELSEENKHLNEENNELKKQIEDLYETDKSLRKMMSNMTLNYRGVTVHRSLYSEVLKILKENGAEDLCADLEKTSIDTSINGC